MTRLIRAEVFKLRTTNLWWLFGMATLVSTVVMLVVNAVAAYSLLKPFDQYVALQTRGRGNRVSAQFLTRLHNEWDLGHSAVTQATTLYRREFTYSPIKSFLFTSSNMKIRTGAIATPLIACEYS